MRVLFIDIQYIMLRHNIKSRKETRVPNSYLNTPHITDINIDNTHITNNFALKKGFMFIIFVKV